MDLSQWFIARSISQDEFEMLVRVNAHFEKIREPKEKQRKIRFYMTLVALFVSIGYIFPFDYTFYSLSADARIGIGITILLSWLIFSLSALLLASLGGWFIGWRRHHKEIGIETERITQICSDAPGDFLAALDLIETLEPGTVRLAAWIVQMIFKNYETNTKRKSVISQPAH